MCFVYNCVHYCRLKLAILFPSAAVAAVVAATTPDSKDSADKKQQIDIGKEAAMEAEVRAARERAIVPLEIRIKSFREMLAEKDVSFIAFVNRHVYMKVKLITEGLVKI